MLNDVSWWNFALQVLGAVVTVLVVTWRVSAVVTRHEEHTASKMREHEIKDEAAFKQIAAAITQSGEAVRSEFGTTVATLRSHMQETQAQTMERIHQIENRLASDYISKDAFFATIKEFNEQTRRNFDEIKDWLKRFDEKVDAIRDRGRDN